MSSETTPKKDLRPGFTEAAEPLMKWLAENMHPHAKAIVDSGSAELVEGVVGHVTDKFIKD